MNNRDLLQPQTKEQIEQAETFLYGRKIGSKQTTISARSHGLKSHFIVYHDDHTPLAYQQQESYRDPPLVGYSASTIQIFESIDPEDEAILLWISGPQSLSPPMTPPLWKELNKQEKLGHATLLFQGCADTTAPAEPGDRGLVNDVKAGITYLTKQHPSTQIFVGAYGLGCGVMFHAVIEWLEENPDKASSIKHLIPIAPFATMEDILQQQRLHPTLCNFQPLSFLSPIDTIKKLRPSISIDFVQPNHRHQAEQLGPFSETLYAQHHVRAPRYQDGSSPTEHAVKLLKETDHANPSRLFLYIQTTKTEIVQNYSTCIITSCLHRMQKNDSPFHEGQKELIIPALDYFMDHEPANQKEKRLLKQSKELLKIIKKLMHNEIDTIPHQHGDHNHLYERHVISIFDHGKSCEYSSLHVHKIAVTFEENIAVELGTTGVIITRKENILHITTTEDCQAHIYFIGDSNNVLQEINIRTPFIRVTPRHHKGLNEFTINDVRYNVRPSLSLVSDNSKKNLN